MIKQILNLLLLALLTIGCAGKMATTTYTVRKPEDTIKVVKTDEGEKTVKVTELTDVFQIEVKEQTPFGHSRTTIPEMIFGYLITQQGEVVGSVGEGFREDPNLIVDYVRVAPLPGNAQDWRRTFVYKNGQGVYRHNQTRKYWHNGGYIGDVSAAAMKAEMGIVD
jgi:hypothetical protein